MAKDFRSDQIRVTKIIGEGGLTQIYSSSNAANYDGELSSSNTGVGNDVWLLISGSSSEEYDGNRNDGSTVLFSGDVVVSGTLYAERSVIEVDESVVGNLRVPNKLLVSGAAVFNTDAGSTADFQVKGDSTTNLLFVDVSADKVGIGTASPTYTLDVVGDIGLDEYLYHNDDSDTNIRFSPDNISMHAGGAHFVDFDELSGSNDRVVFNPSGSTINFQVEGTSDEHAIFVNASTDRVGIGSSEPAAKLHVAHSGSDAHLRLEYGGPTSGSAYAQWTIDASNNLRLEIPTGLAEYAVEADLAVSGNFYVTGTFSPSSLVINEEGATSGDFRSEGDTNTHLLFVDASRESIGINNDSPVYKLDLIETGSQLKLGYDSVDGGYATFDVTSSGALTIASTDNSAAAGHITLDADGDIILDADSADIIFKDGGTDLLHFTNSSSSVIMSASVSDADIIFKGSTGGSSVEIARFDTSQTGLLMASSKKIMFADSNAYIYGDGTDVHIGVTDAGDINIPASIGLTFGDDGEKIEGDGSALTISGGTVTIDSEGDIFLDTDGADVVLKEAGTEYGRLTQTGGELVVKSSASSTTAITFSGANATFAGNTTIEGTLTVQGSTTTLDSTNLLIEDPVILLASGTTSTNSNGGIAIASGSSSADKALVFGRVADDTWGVGTKDITDGTVTTLADMYLTKFRASQLQLTGTNHYIDVASDNLTFTTAGDAHIDATGDIILDADGDNVTLKDGSNTVLDIVMNSTTEITLDAPGNINLDADGGKIDLQDGGTTFLRFQQSGGSVILTSSIDTKDIIFNGDDEAEVFRIDSSAKSLKMGSNRKIEFADTGESIVSDGTDLTIESAGDIKLSSGGNNITFITGSTTALDFVINGSTDITLDAPGDIKFDAAGNDYIFNPGGTESFRFTANAETDMKINVAGDMKLDAAGNDYIFDPSGTESFRFTANSTTSATWDVVGDAIIDAGGGDLELKDDGTSILKISNSSSDIVFQPQVSNKDLIFKGAGGDEVFRLDTSADTLRIADSSKIILGGTDYDGDSIGENAIWSASNKLHISGTQILFMSGGASTVDESSGADINFYVSGTSSSQGSSVRGTSLFGGDVMISGSLKLGGSADFSSVTNLDISSAGSYRFGDATARMYRSSDDLMFDDGNVVTAKSLSDLASSTTNTTAAFFIQHDSLRSMIRTTGSVSFDTDGNYTNMYGDDVYFFVSGAVGKKGSTVVSGTAVFGGDVVLSGAAYIGTGSFGHIGAANNTVLEMKASAANHFNIDQKVADKDIRFRVNDSDGGGEGQEVLRLKGDTQAVRVIAGANFELGGSTRYLHSSASTAIDIVNNNASGQLNLLAGTSGTPGNVNVRGTLLPTQDATFDLGSSTYRWANIYTGDLHLKNDRGDWTIVEEENMLTVVNNLTGKRYKMMLELLEGDE